MLKFNTSYPTSRAFSGFNLTTNSLTNLYDDRQNLLVLCDPSHNSLGEGAFCDGLCHFTEVCWGRREFDVSRCVFRLLDSHCHGGPGGLWRVICGGGWLKEPSRDHCLEFLICDGLWKYLNWLWCGCRCRCRGILSLWDTTRSRLWGLYPCINTGTGTFVSVCMNVRWQSINRFHITISYCPRHFVSKSRQLSVAHASSPVGHWSPVTSVTRPVCHIAIGTV